MQVRRFHLSDLSHEAFYENYRNKRPFVLTDLAHNWAALERWADPNYFIKKLAREQSSEDGPYEDDVFVAKDNLTFVDNAQVCDKVKVPFGDLMRHVFELEDQGMSREDVKDKLTNKRVYMRAPLWKEIEGDIKWPHGLVFGRERDEEEEKEDQTNQKIKRGESFSGNLSGMAHKQSIHPLPLSPFGSLCNYFVTAADLLQVFG